MGALPKKKPSKSRTRKRRAQWSHGIPLPTISKCEHCGTAKIWHRVCKECGYYRGKQMIEPKTKVRRVKT